MERQVMDYFLRGDDPTLAMLREQSAVAVVAERRFTGVGFFTRFKVPISAPRLPSRCRLVVSDVYAEVTNLEFGAGFVLFVEDGALDTLEGYIFEDAWPGDTKLKRVYYQKPKGGRGLVETAERDLGWAMARNTAEQNLAADQPRE